MPPVGLSYQAYIFEGLLAIIEAGLPEQTDVFATVGATGMGSTETVTGALGVVQPSNVLST